MNLYSGRTPTHKRILVACLAIVMLTASAAAGDAASTTPKPSAPTEDGEHAFDWELGTWRSDVRVLADPLSDSEDEWLRFRGTSVVRPMLDSRANVVEFDVTGPAGRIQALNFRLYETDADRWSLTFVNLRDGLLTPSVYGGFRGGVGEFYGRDQLNGRPIEVRFLIYRQGPDQARFEQAFSDDDGQTWETNWIVVDRRVD